MSAHSLSHVVGPESKALAPVSASSRPPEVSASNTIQLDGGVHAMSDAAAVHSTAAAGVGGSASTLPHLDRIQQSFGRHDVTSVAAHTDHRSTQANRVMGSRGYAVGNHVAFSGSPDLHTAAHEAAHVVQQRANAVSTPNGIGRAGDRYERHADTVADRVVQGESAEPVLDQMTGGFSTSNGSADAGAVQHKLNMVAGYTETLNWSGEAVELIETWEQYESVMDALEAPMRGRTSRTKAKKYAKLLQFKQDMEATEITNDHDIRVEKTAQITFRLGQATKLLSSLPAQPAVNEPSDVNEAETDGLDLPTRLEALGSETTTVASSEGERLSDLPAAMGGLQPTTEQTEEEAAREQAEAEAPVKLRLKIMETEGPSRKGRLGEAEAKADAGINFDPSGTGSAELTGEISVLAGKKLETTSSPVPFVGGSQGRVQASAVLGATASASATATASYDSEKGLSGGLQGKAGAFAGGAFSVTPTVELVGPDNQTLASGSTTVGVTYGYGAEYEGEGSFQWGKFKLKSKGKVSAGLGMEWGVAFDVDLPAIYNRMIG
ncbi:MAG TPA: hypothetical protein DFR83_00235 [Deltaproteobacteria bacterium]|nr:hypothetical protein [Deltaproteobacteria bacterium]